MKYWFIIVIGIMLFSMAAVSLSEYRQRKNIIGEVTQYKGYIEIIDDNPNIDGTRIGIMEENLVANYRSAGYLHHPSQHPEKPCAHDDAGRKAVFDAFKQQRDQD